MRVEIEVKFLSVNHEEIRTRLKDLEAVCVEPMRLMRRAIIDFPDRRLMRGETNSFIRIRDEGEKITLTFKQFKSLGVDGAQEIETTVDSFENTLNIFVSAGLELASLQESRRETWELKGCEIVLDEWPWLNPYIEIEGKSEEALKSIAEELCLDWAAAAFGDVMVAYRAQYPHLNVKETVADLKEVRFDMPLPQFLQPDGQ